MSNFLSKLSNVVSLSQYVKQHYSKGFVSQLFDVITLYRLNPTCNIFDYYKYQVYTVQRGSALYNELLGSGSLEAFSRSLNPRNAVTPGWDKLLFAVLCKAYNVQTAEILAIYKPAGSAPDFIEHQLTDFKELKEFLQSAKMPIFVKPVKSALGLGAFFIAEADMENERIIDKNGNAVSFEEFISKTISLTGHYHYKSSAGILFQRPIVQHSAITEFTQIDSPSGLRIMVLNTGNGPYIHRALWKIITPGNISDNLSKGRSGNMVAQIDISTGRVSEAVNGYWPYTQFFQRHPISNRKLSDFTLPLWEQVKRDVLRASAMITGMGVMHWDVIISENGAVFLELNDIGGTTMTQLHGKGLIDKELKEYLRKNGILQKGSAFARFINR